MTRKRPIIGGYVTESIGWRWVFHILTIAASFTFQSAVPLGDLTSAGCFCDDSEYVYERDLCTDSTGTQSQEAA
jgi:hypothetical protein